MNPIHGMRAIRFAFKSAPIMLICALVSTIFAYAVQFYLMYQVAHVAQAVDQEKDLFLSSLKTLIPLLILTPLLGAVADHCIYLVESSVQRVVQPEALAYELDNPGETLTEQTQSWVGQEGISLVFYVIQQRLSGLVALCLLATWNLFLALLLGMAMWYSGVVVARYHLVMQQELSGTSDEAALRSKFYWRTLIDPEFAEETRLYGLGEVLVGRFIKTSELKFSSAKLRARQFWKLNIRAQTPFIACLVLYIAWHLFHSEINYAGFFSALVIALPGLAGLGSLGSIQVRAHEFEEMLRVIETKKPSALDDRDTETNAVTPTEPIGLEPEPLSASSIIELRNVSFSYGTRHILAGIDLNVGRGEKIAIVGENGAGKSTLMKLLVGQLTPDTGTISIAGQTPTTRSTQGLGIGLVPQDYMQPPLLVSECVHLGREQLHPHAAKVQEQLGIAHIAQAQRKGSNNFSQGQWQKLAIARCLVTPQADWGRLLILDEPTASLDIQSEKALYTEVINNSTAQDSLIIVTHRLSSIATVDRIVVLGQGKILEQGTHAELIASDGLYARMFSAQEKSYAVSNERSCVDHENK
ncbi:ATP-binding cassette domain-containing protein [Corynebacterium kutscheri]|uniref:ATP-binding cassette domain-containing protein n=2 Tax=Corynebacterium kutscheri TaxID=35755 RepID=UPI0006238E82|nr:ABC transporter ATP-binding protein [Corynebacterium kutscheri]